MAQETQRGELNNVLCTCLLTHNMFGTLSYYTSLTHAVIMLRSKQTD